MTKDVWSLPDLWRAKYFLLATISLLAPVQGRADVGCSYPQLANDGLPYDPANYRLWTCPSGSHCGWASGCLWDCTPGQVQCGTGCMPGGSQCCDAIYGGSCPAGSYCGPKDHPRWFVWDKTCVIVTATPDTTPPNSSQLAPQIEQQRQADFAREQAALQAQRQADFARERAALEAQRQAEVAREQAAIEAQRRADLAREQAALQAQRQADFAREQAALQAQRQAAFEQDQRQAEAARQQAERQRVINGLQMQNEQARQGTQKALDDLQRQLNQGQSPPPLEPPDPFQTGDPFGQ
jgi:hypothetical protein